jgi:hypothetical protein
VKIVDCRASRSNAGSVRPGKRRSYNC